MACSTLPISVGVSGGVEKIDVCSPALHLLHHPSVSVSLTTMQDIREDSVGGAEIRADAL